ncbi:hypothetical protein DXG01_016340 [Tephrocybe rancida]|nr:hypothetical protein DXG01_016340 [Tephrocybe rancida]
MGGFNTGNKRLRPGNYTTIFPATRPPPEPPVKTTILQSAERGANFLRTYLPDVDIPAELIRDELAQDAKITERLGVFDPYIGNLLQPIVAYDSAFIAFPMGELNRDLNLSPFSDTGNGITFKPAAHPTRTFDTPIQQIATSAPGMQTAYMAVRTFGQTSLLEVNTSKTTPYLAEVAFITNNDTGGRTLVDVTLSTAPFSSLAVNDLGSVYLCSILGGEKHVDLLRPAIKNTSQSQSDSFWRLARGTHDSDYLLASKDSVFHVDIRSNDSNQLFTSTGTDILTSMEDRMADHIIKLSSTREILWIDTRYPRRPLLGYKHGRQYDRYLEVRTSPLSPAITLLTSRVNAMVTLYDVSRSEGQLLHVDSLPSCFITGPDATTPYAGQALFKHPLDTGMDTFSLLRLTDQGSLHQVDLSMADEVVTTFNTSWTAEVDELAWQPLRTLETPYENQAYAETNLSVSYDQIFCLHERARRKREEDETTAVYDLLETIPTFWQKNEAPSEHILTTYDVILRAGDEPAQAARADFLTESIMNSTRGFRALAQGRLSPAALSESAPWHKNITPILQRLDPTFPDDIESGAEALKRYDLAENPERSVQSIKYEKEAREQVALDLALSSDVFSSQPFSRASDEGLALEALTKTLSLAGGPPPVDFGYLRPKISNHYRTEEPDEIVSSTGVRSLLKDWQVGADPDDYVFTDHYDGSTPTPQLTRKAHPGPTTENVPPQLGTQSQRPPTVLAASAVPVRPPELGRRVFVQSQPDPERSLPRTLGYGGPSLGLAQTQPSQEYMTSTQILPGAHGGRPMLPKKKPAKKRVGGF